jgi:hypothetical protein
MAQIEDVMGVESEAPAKRAVMLALKVAGGTCWVAAYELAHREGRRSSVALLPPAAIAANLAWECLYTAGGVYKWRDLTVEDRIQTLINGAWLVQDVRWVHLLRRSGIQIPPLYYFGAAMYQLAFLAGRQPGDAARQSALLQNLAFSTSSALNRPQPPISENVFTFTLLRAFGTAVPTATSGILRGYRPLYLLPGIGCLFMDGVRYLRLRRASAQ